MISSILQALVKVSEITENQSEVNPLCYYVLTNKPSTLRKRPMGQKNYHPSQKRHSKLVSGAFWECFASLATEVTPPHSRGRHAWAQITSTLPMAGYQLQAHNLTQIFLQRQHILSWLHLQRSTSQKHNLQNYSLQFILRGHNYS